MTDLAPVETVGSLTLPDSVLRSLHPFHLSLYLLWCVQIADPESPSNLQPLLPPLVVVLGGRRLKSLTRLPLTSGEVDGGTEVKVGTTWGSMTVVSLRRIVRFK